MQQLMSNLKQLLTVKKSTSLTKMHQKLLTMLKLISMGRKKLPTTFTKTKMIRLSLYLFHQLWILILRCQQELKVILLQLSWILNCQQSFQMFLFLRSQQRFQVFLLSKNQQSDNIIIKMYCSEN